MIIGRSFFVDVEALVLAGDGDIFAGVVLVVENLLKVSRAAGEGHVDDADDDEEEDEAEHCDDDDGPEGDGQLGDAALISYEDEPGRAREAVLGVVGAAAAGLLAGNTAVAGQHEGRAAG
jgi:hypothetical protein